MTSNHRRTALLEVATELATQMGFEPPQYLREGLEFSIFRTRVGSRELVLRVPHEAHMSNDNDPSVDAHALQVQERAITDYLWEHKVPVARYEGPIEVRGLPCLVGTYVHGDQTPACRFQVGRLLADLHAVRPPPHFEPVAHEQTGVPEALATRVHRRWTRLRELVPTPMPAPVTLTALTQLYQPLMAEPRVLHMDFRPANLLASGGDLRAIVDWSNLMFAHPQLELARLAEFALVDPPLAGDLQAILTAYRTFNCDPDVPGETRMACRLDSALMLAIVFWSESPRPALQMRQSARVCSLIERLQ